MKSPMPQMLNALILTGALGLVGCSSPKPWPESPLYEAPVNDPAWVAPATELEAMEAMAGHYAHYDVVAYQGETPNGPLSTFIISYGFTDLVVEDGELDPCVVGSIARRPDHDVDFEFAPIREARRSPVGLDDAGLQLDPVALPKPAWARADQRFARA